MASLGGAAHPGCHHFGVTPYYEVKPYLHWFVVKIFFPSSFELKTNQCSWEDLFLFWNSHICGPKTHYFDGNDLFFLFGLHLFLDRKRVTPRNSAPGATIPSNAAAKMPDIASLFHMHTLLESDYAILTYILPLFCFVSWPKREGGMAQCPLL